MAVRLRILPAVLLTVMTVLALLAGSLLAVPLPGARADDESACDAIRVRPNAASLSAQQWDDLIEAMLQVQRTGRYDAFVRTYGQAAPEFGGRPVQLPFLRAHLAEFEDVLRTVDPDVVLPYWDLGASAQAPELGPVWGPDRLGGNGNPAKGGVVTDGRFKDWKPVESAVSALTRAWTGPGWIAPFPSTASTAAQLAAATTYDEARQALSALQGAVHAGVGGDLSSQHAPNDPVYWFAAADIDRLWAGWQAEHAPGSYDGQNANGSAAQVGDPVPGHPGTTVADTLDTLSFCYSYGLAVGPTALADGVAGLPYQAQLSAAPGAPASTTYALMTGSLPAGLTLSPSGAVSGTPSAPGTATFTVAATDAASGMSGRRTYVLTVGAVTGISITAPFSAVAGTPVDLTATALNGDDPVGDITAETTFAPASAGTSCAGSTCTFTKAGTAQVTGTYGGHTDVASIAVQPAAPAAVVAVSGQLQQVDPGQTFPDPFVARVQDAHGNPVSDRTVEFTVPGGWGASFPGGATTFTSGSREDGTVTSPLLTVGSRTGLLTVMARVAGISDAAAFTVVVREPAAPVPAKADLAVRVLGPDRAQRGRTVRLRIVVTNQGPATTTATARVTVPFRWDVRGTGGGALKGRRITVPVGPLAAGEKAVVRIKVVPRGWRGVRLVRATVHSPLPDPRVRDNGTFKRIRVER